MTPPRRFYGSSPPGRLESTMLKVLAAEMSDAGRLRRGKAYFAEGAVLDVSIEPSIAEVLVQGGSPTPYDVSISVEPGSGVPNRSEIDSYCPCPDAERHEYGLCKHGVAALFAIANEVAIEPEVLERWRSATGSNITSLRPAPPEATPGDDDDGGLAPVTELFPTPSQPVRQPIDDPVVQHINRLLLPSNEPGSRSTPDFGEVSPVRHPSTGDRLLDDVLGDALSELHLDLG